MKSLKILGAFLFILSSGIAGYFVYSHFKESSVQGVTITESSWTYRRSIFIENTEAIYTEKEIILEIDTASLIAEGKLQDDCTDLRFLESETSYSLNFQIEGECNSNNTQIKVIIPSLPAGGENIYMFYGNPKAIPLQTNVDNI